MTRALALALALGGCAAVGAEAPAPVPMHAHIKAELGMSCAEACSPWVCDVAYGIEEGAEVACGAEAERFAMCICSAPQGG